MDRRFPRRVEKILYWLPDPIRSYVDGVWFEDYIAKRLEKLGWKVWPHVYVFGVSGVKLEIDVLAVKNGMTLIVECKTGSEDQKALPKFIAKFYDIKTNLALFISTQKIDPQNKALVKKNPAFRVIDDIKNEKGVNLH